MCYSIYLLHYEVISAVGRLERRLGETAPFWIYLSPQLALVGGAIVMVCGIYFVIIEKPCMHRDWPKRLWRREQKIIGTRFRWTQAKAAE